MCRSREGDAADGEARGTYCTNMNEREKKHDVPCTHASTVYLYRSNVYQEFPSSQ